MRAEEREDIVQHPLLAACRPETLDFLLQGAFVQRFPAHTQLTREGERPTSSMRVLSGAHRAFRLLADRETTIAVIGPPHTFIVAAVVLDRLYLQSARVLEPSPHPDAAVGIRAAGHAPRRRFCRPPSPRNWPTPIAMSRRN